LKGYNVNRAGQYEVIWQPTYDYQTYAAAGATQFTFFQTTVGAAGATLATTNIRAAGQFPRPQEFLCTGIQILFTPGNVVAAGGVATAVAQENWNDVTDVLFGNAFLDLFIGSKSYLQDAPLAKFAQQFRITGTADQADSSTAGVVNYHYVDYAVSCGRYYSITPVKIPANQNFNVTLNFPAVIAVAVDATIGVILDGFLYRLSQ
jgi:hypothetical protein